MTEQEKNKDIEQEAEDLARDLANALAEEMTKEEEPIEEIIEVEALTEEMTEEEAPVEEIAEEEAPVEEIAEEEAPVEEIAEEEAPAEVATKKRGKALFITMGCVLAVIGILLGIYFGVAKHYEKHFFQGTSVNGNDCSGTSVEEVEANLRKQVESYAITIIKEDGSEEQIKGTDIGIKYIGSIEVRRAFAEQNPYLWPKYLTKKSDIKTKFVVDYDHEQLAAAVANLECMKAENQTVAVAATVVYKDGQFVVQEETYGTQLDVTKMTKLLHETISSMGQSVNLKEAECYIQPTYTKDSQEVLAAKNEMNKYLQADITYSFENIEVKVGKEQISSWISVGADMKPVISKDAVKKFANTLGSKYNTANKSGILETPTGKQVTIKNAKKGRTVGVDAEIEQLISEVKEGKTVVREPIFSQKETQEGQYTWGNTYVEVDITAQHMWYIVNNEIVFETDVVTGKKGKNDTPTGVYTILEKIKGKYLRGRLVNGKPSYVTWVDYWMRVTWSGIGFHDAPWQPTFGGDRYVNNGSHGCINMPPAKAKEFYGMLSKGTTVIIHY